ncbi:MAG: hypothetical protein JST31_00295 [Actinobacteria bacterium]|nr:hypothetical protein [Actinomycetota bacterium]
MANVAGPDPNATYWTTPFKTDRPFRSLTIRGTYPEARNISFVVYNSSGGDFTEKVRGKTVGSALTDYEIAPDRGSVNPWQVDSVPPGRGMNFTVRIRRGVTAGEQKRLNAIPMVDTEPVEQNPIAPEDVGFVTFRTYVPSGGNKTVKLPTVIVNRTVERHGRHSRPRVAHIQLPTCNSARIAHAAKVSGALKQIAAKVKGEAVPTTPVTPCTVDGQPRYSNGCAKPLEWSQSSSDQVGALFPDPSNAYISMYFYPSPGTVVVTRGLMPTTPRAAGSGELGNSIGATPVDWTAAPLPYQLRYWSVNNYLLKEPYPVVTEGVGPNRRYGGTADYQTAVDANGYYTVVSSLPGDKPSSASLAANSATWIPMQGDQPSVAESQWMRNMMGESFQYAIQQIPHAASPTEYIPSSVVAQVMGPYYPTSAQCPVSVFEAQGTGGCLAVSSPATGPTGD